MNREHGPFDVVLANLLIPIIEALGPDLAAAVAPGGHLVLGGLLSDPSLGHVDRALTAIGNSEVRETGGGRTADLHGWATIEIVVPD